MICDLSIVLDFARYKVHNNWRKSDLKTFCETWSHQLKFVYKWMYRSVSTLERPTYGKRSKARLDSSPGNWLFFCALYILPAVTVVTPIPSPRNRMTFLATFSFRGDFTASSSVSWAVLNQSFCHDAEHKMNEAYISMASVKSLSTSTINAHETVHWALAPETVPHPWPRPTLRPGYQNSNHNRINPPVINPYRDGSSTWLEVPEI